MKEIQEQFWKFLEKNGFSQSAIQNYIRSVGNLEKFLRKRGVSIQQPEQITMRMLEERKGSFYWYSERTINNYIHGVRKFLFFCDVFDYEVINYKKILLIREKKPEMVYIKPDQVEKYLNIIQRMGLDYLSTIRNFVIVRALWQTGMRISELLSVKKEDIRSDGGVEIIGKGRKRRVVFLTPDIVKSINFYEYLKGERGVFSEYVFISHANNSFGKKLSRCSVEELFRKINKKLWIKEHLTPHSFRHGFASEVVRKWGNIADLQRTLWHENSKTTGIYIHSNDERVRETQGLVSWIGEHLLKLKIMEQKRKEVEYTN